MLARIRRNHQLQGLIPGILLCLIPGIIAGCATDEPRELEELLAEPAAKVSPKETLEVPPPPFTEGYYPCSICHNGEDVLPNPQRRVLEDEHENIVLKHDEEHRWCLDCHDLNNRDKLHLANGEFVDFEESYRLCGQCHGPKLRDWKAGIHGRRKGYWNGHKQYLLCAHCHNPHQPGFKPIKPEPPPIRPPKPGLFKQVEAPSPGRIQGERGAR